jgi:hypothetical protein
MERTISTKSRRRAGKGRKIVAGEMHDQAGKGRGKGRKVRKGRSVSGGC